MHSPTLMLTRAQMLGRSITCRTSYYVSSSSTLQQNHKSWLALSNAPTSLRRVSDLQAWILNAEEIICRQVVDVFGDDGISVTNTQGKVGKRVTVSAKVEYVFPSRSL